LFIALLISFAGCSAFGTSIPTLQTQLATPTLIPATSTSVRQLPANATSARPVDSAVGALLDKVQDDRLMLTVNALQEMHTRHVLSTSTATTGIGTARDWLIKQFSAIRDANRTQPIDVWTQAVPLTFNGIKTTVQNVVAVFQGTDIGGGVIIVGAHYDSITTDFFNGTAYAPGANDDGSGIAALLEIARILAPLAHRATILFVGFTAEESGRQGSLAFVKSYLQAQNPPIDVRGMINMDIIGSDVGPNGQIDPRSIRVFSAEPNTSPSRQFARQIDIFVSTYIDNMTIVLQSSEDRVGRWGDHQSFSAAGYPSLRIIQSLEDTTKEHSPLDIAENVQPDYLLRVTRAALVSAILLSSGPLPPGGITLTANALAWDSVPTAAGYVVALRTANSLGFDQVLAVNQATQMPWDNLSKYDFAAVSAVDANGRMGPFSPEIPLH
jgi:hypothetical protein